MLVSTGERSRLSCITQVLQAVLKEFNLTANLHKNAFIPYFCKRLRRSLQAQIYNRNRDLDFGEEAVDQIVNVRAKTSLQPLQNKENRLQVPKRLLAFHSET